MGESLKVAGLGMNSALAAGAEYNAAAIRCGYSGVVKQKASDDSQETLPMARVPLSEDLRGNKRLSTMLLPAIEEALQGLPEGEQVPILLCLAQDNQYLTSRNTLPKEMFEAIQTSDIHTKIDYKNTTSSNQGRVSFVYALEHAKKLLKNANYALIAGVDSYVSVQRYSYYQAQKRIFSPENVDGFIPGEAAVALLLTKEKIQGTTEVLGFASASEPHPIVGNKPVTGNGLTEAVNKALEAYEIKASDTDFRISSVSGEAYFFREASIAHGRTMDTLQQSHPLWHPADHIGEVGAAVGGAMMVMAHYAFQKGYAPGSTALCQLSNDDLQRGAFVLRNKGE